MASAKRLGKSCLEGYELRFNKISTKDGSGKCNIVPGGSGVYLAVFEILESERSILDRWEGLGEGYNCLEVDVGTFGFCSTYIADSGAIDESRQPMDWYKEMVLLGCVANEFPDSYVQTIEIIPATEDSDAERAHRQWKIVEDLRNGT